MKLGCLLVSVLVATGCVAPAPGEDPVATSSSQSAGGTEVTNGAFCNATFCDENFPCPLCDGHPGFCGPDFTCVYGGGGPGPGGPGGPGGPRCDASLCLDVSQCFAACPNATSAACIDGACVY